LLKKVPSTVYMIPCPIAERNVSSLPTYEQELIHSLTYFIVERSKTARKFLKEIKHPISQQELHVEEMDKHDEAYAQNVLKEWLEKGHNIGIISEAGCPGIADPGAKLVAQSHRKNIQVVPLIGPSSILLSLMASGLNGQTFTFHGYLPNKKQDLVQKLKSLEKSVRHNKSSELFIETPYRNIPMFDEIIRTCSGEISLCIAADITGEQEFIKTKKIKIWKKTGFPLKDKVPAIFILGQ